MTNKQLAAQHLIEAAKLLNDHNESKSKQNITIIISELQNALKINKLNCEINFTMLLDDLDNKINVFCLNNEDTNSIIISKLIWSKIIDLSNDINNINTIIKYINSILDNGFNIDIVLDNLDYCKNKLIGYLVLYKNSNFT